MQNQFGNPDQAEIQAYLAQVMGGAEDPELQRQRQEAEEAARQQRMIAGLGQAGSTIGAAIGGIKTPDQSFYKGLSQQADQGLANFNKQQAAETSKRLMLAQHLSDRFDRKEDIARQERLANENRKFQETEKEKDRKFREKQAEDARKQQEKIAQMNLEAKRQQIANQIPPAQKKLDDRYTEDYNRFTGKGRVNAEQTISQLEELKNELIEESKNFIQAGGGRWTAFLPDSARATKSLRWKSEIPGKANLVLKELFGGNMSNEERKSEADTYYNDMLQPAENAVILQKKIDTMKYQLAAEAQKAEYFRNNGTLLGYEGFTTGKESVANLPRSDGKILSGSAYANEQNDGVRMRRVRAPNGVVRSIPETDVQAAIAAGGELVD